VEAAAVEAAAVEAAAADLAHAQCRGGLLERRHHLAVEAAAAPSAKLLSAGEFGRWISSAASGVHRVEAHLQNTAGFI
jgi:hypothetical protein